jgi:hypothetical protein
MLFGEYGRRCFLHVQGFAEDWLTILADKVEFLRDSKFDTYKFCTTLPLTIIVKII